MNNKYGIKRTLAELPTFDQKVQYLQGLGEFINREIQLIASKQGEWVESLPEDEEVQQGENE